MNQHHPIAVRTAGDHVREWRQRRRLSQLDFALDAGISQKHLSFVETGRSQPSRDMLLRLADELDMPLRERNLMLVSGGYAPVFGERSLDDPALKPARAAVDLILRGHEPYPAIAVDRLWRLVAHNRAVPALLGLASDRRLLEPPVNVLRLTLAPGGLAPAITNYAEWRAHILDRLRQQIERTADPELIALLQDLAALPFPAGQDHAPVPRDFAGVLVPLEIRTPAGALSLFSTTTVFGTPVDITLSELVLEAFYPADDATALLLRTMAGAA
jgi:transcriptional regulator with XRE-family HTH domain